MSKFTEDYVTRNAQLTVKRLYDSFEIEVVANFWDADLRQHVERVARAGWNGKGMWLALQRPDAGGKMTLPYIYMKTADDQLVPWLASQTDMLGEDWLEVVTQ